MTNGKIKVMLAIIDEKIAKERDMCKEYNTKAAIAEPGMRQYYKNEADYHMGIAHGLEIAKEAIIQSMKD